ncbi:MAG: RdgB/HAM1 family non-canonical purine NTP pyrophosphatase [Kistimonas sp.]|nr:RdgB/HAM1 family non-canonical purine NTP pyrophosphatase [Kistimonas sp.]
MPVSASDSEPGRSPALELVLATGNSGKLAEFRQLMAHRSPGIHLHPQSDFFSQEAEETGATFVENAIIKARHAAKLSQLPALADDSGLEVDCLAGAPGVFSRRFAGSQATDADNITCLLQRMQGVPRAQRRARFQCVLVYMRHALDPVPVICQGTWEGVVLEAPRGQQGHGYDPVFEVPERQCTAAELDMQVKNSISHRAQALQQMLERLSAL